MLACSLTPQTRKTDCKCVVAPECAGKSSAASLFQKSNTVTIFWLLLLKGKTNEKRKMFLAQSIKAYPTICRFLLLAHRHVVPVTMFERMYESSHPTISFGKIQHSKDAKVTVQSARDSCAISIFSASRVRRNAYTGEDHVSMIFFSLRDIHAHAHTPAVSYQL